MQNYFKFNNIFFMIFKVARLLTLILCILNVFFVKVYAEQTKAEFEQKQEEHQVKDEKTNAPEEAPEEVSADVGTQELNDKKNLPSITKNAPQENLVEHGDDKSSAPSPEIDVISTSQSVTKPAIQFTKSGLIASFADLVEPLMPSVVNIYTIKYNSAARIKQWHFQDLFPFEQFNNLFDELTAPFALDNVYSNPRALSLGSGFIIDEVGHIVTNHHVIANADEIHVRFADNKEYPATIIGVDPKTDLALIKINVKEKLKFIKFGDSALSRVGDVVIAIGNPLGFGGTVTQGIISSKSRDLGDSADDLVGDFLQTDAAINAGNSGGPLFNMSGEVIGVNSAVPAIGGGRNIGIGFAIPANTVKSIVLRLQKDGQIQRGRLDIKIQEVTEDLADAFNLENYKGGVLVVDVKPGGSGDSAGIKQGDVITGFNGTAVTSPRKLQLFVAESGIGEEVKLNIIRDGAEHILVAKINQIPKAAKISSSDDNFEIKGIIFGNITDKIIDKYGFDKNLTGIVVLQTSGSAMRFSLKPGDVIIGVNKQTILNVSQFKDLYKEAKENKQKKLVLLVKRGDFSLFTLLPVQ